MKRKIIGCLLAANILFGCQISDTEAASRAELATINVSQAQDFQYWQKDTKALRALTDYVQAVTSEGNPDFIPVESRIAVFDMDGTLLGERTPTYFERLLFLHRALDDPSFQPTEEEKQTALATRKCLENKQSIPVEQKAREDYLQTTVFADMSLTEFESYVESYMDKPVEGMSNLKYGEAFYLPMVEVVSYLHNNGFTCCLVSGTDREEVRILAKGVLPVAPRNVIGTDSAILASGQGEAAAEKYTYTANDKLLRGNLSCNLVKMEKVAAIRREFGCQPVLAFGNSSGDASMLNYTLADNPYRALAFGLLCDDTERENGSLKAAQKMKDDCQENGWIPISMRDDFLTIYGEDVTFIKH